MAGGKLKETRSRIQSVSSTQQITKAMKMVAAAKLRMAQKRIIAIRPYSYKLSGMLRHLIANVRGEIKIHLSEERGDDKVLLVPITSDRGLCGSFNSNIIKRTRNLMNEAYSNQNQAGNVQLLCIGKKGSDYFKRHESNIIDDYVELFKNLTFDNAAKIADFMMESYIGKQYDKVELIYGRFKNAATQVIVHDPMLPFSTLEPEEEDLKKIKMTPNYIYEPSRENLVYKLIPKVIRTQLFRALLDSNASEHGARMTSMDHATENAGEILRDLKITYNRARQAAITTELTEIVGGANALEEG